MNYIKQSFKKIFLPILIFCAALTVVSKLMEWLAAFLYQFAADDVTAELMSFTDYVAMLNSSDNWYNNLWSVLVLLIVSPLYIGLYGFCFARLRGENPKKSTLFDFYKSPKKFLGSFAARSVMGAAIAVVIAVLYLTIIRFILFADEDYNMSSVTFSSSVSVSLTASVLIIVAVTAVMMLFFFFTEYSYALFSEDGVVNAVKNSFAMAKRYWLRTLGIMVLIGAVNGAFSALILGLGTYFKPIELLAFVSTAVTMWIGVTFVHSLLAGGKPKVETADEQADEENEDDLIVKPYDFFIEADTRFADSKTFEAEAIREVDILAVLDEMNLADEVKTNWGVKRKLKRLFNDLAFEVGEYVSYEGGREISGTDIEEIDERELEISVAISRDSDSEPFTAVISISEVGE
ncbi:MAG: hypothetical protein IJ305_05345 [Oscillospiraceae bacterium]|nr:hypothetical protein [Oscillospiraceae bacterium]